MLLRVLKALSRAERVSAKRPMMVSSTAMGLDIGILHFLHKLSWLWGAKTSTALSSHAKVVREAVSDYKDVSELSYRKYLVAVQRGENATFDLNKFKGQPFVKEENLVAVVKSNEVVTSIYFPNVGLGTNAFANLMDSFGKSASNLTAIDISENPNVDLNAPAIRSNMVIPEIPTLSSLVSFKADGCSISGDGAIFFGALPEGLTTLHLNKVAGLEDAVDKLCEFLAKAKDLSSFCIQGCNLSDKSMAKILEALKDKHLEELRIGGNQLDFYSYPSLKKLFKSSRLPKFLDLSGVCNDGLISSCLEFTPQNLSGVQYLGLKNNGLTAEHVLDMFSGFAEAKPAENSAKKKVRGRPKKQEREEIDLLPTEEVSIPQKANKSLVLDLSDNKLESNCYPALKNISTWTKDFTVKLSPNQGQLTDYQKLVKILGENEDRKIKIDLSSSSFLPWQVIVLQNDVPGNVEVGPVQEVGLITKLEAKMVSILNSKGKRDAMARE